MTMSEPAAEFVCIIFEKETQTIFFPYPLFYTTDIKWLICQSGRHQDLPV